ncbi:MAG: glycosyltransferase family 4 protein [Candidatus Aenigmatarchaeota archaeon]|nr:MAG: glycosyltransferase family 4 protein [Candidatus Aenigmarchaeota archaeon]
MKIGIVTSLFYPYSVGGAETSAYYLSRGLAKAGHDVLLITPHLGGNYPSYEKDGFKIYRFNIGRVSRFLHKIRSRSRFRFPFTTAFDPFFHYHFKRNIKLIVKCFKPDILHVQHSPALIPTYKAAKGVKMVATLRDYTTYCDSGYCSLAREYKKCSLSTYLNCKHKWDKQYSEHSRFDVLFKFFKSLLVYRLAYHNLKFKQMVLRKMNGVINVSGFVRDVYKKIGVEGVVIHNIAPGEKVEKPVSKIKKELGVSGKIVSYVGKISIGKGANQILEMIKILNDVNFVVAGTGPLDKDFERASKEYENLIYRRHVPHDQAMEIYKASDVVCSTSVWPEPLSRVIIEALSVGTPCIATNVGGSGEIIDDGINGFLIEPENVNELVGKVKVLLSDKKMRGKFAKNGKLKIKEDFSSDKIINKHVAFYKRVVGLK